jgi:hypothetical protein
MSQETVPAPITEQVGLTVEQQQVAADLISRVSRTQASSEGASRDLQHTHELEDMGKKVPMARLVGQAGMNAAMQFRANKAVKAAKGHYEQNTTAYQEQAVIDAAEDGVEINR